MSPVLTDDVDNILQTLLDGIQDTVLIVDPPGVVIEEYVDVAIGMDDPPVVRILADESILKEALGDFLVAGNAADLVEGGVLSLRTAAVSPGNALVLTEHRLSALVTAGENMAALTVDGTGFGGDAFDYYTAEWSEAESYSLRTPPLTRVRETLRESIGPNVAEDFEAVLESLETARGDNEGLDEVTISLLVAAKNQELLYDISKWGEDVGIASKATFSRTKTSLEDLGLIDTEKVPIDVGRPRLRLRFADEQLTDASAGELASVAKGLMA